MTIALSADKAAYAVGEPVFFTLRVANETSKPVHLSFRTAQRFDLVIHDSQGREVWRWSGGRVFGQVLEEETLNPDGGELLFRAIIERGLPKGMYTVTGIIPALEGALLARTTLTIR